jgi:chromate transporter
MMTTVAALSTADWLGLFAHFLMISMLAIGGAIAAAPEMHRYVVVEQGWLSDAQFTSSVALAQAAPGPNLLFVAVIGWNLAGIAGAAVTMIGILIPSTTFALAVTRWAAQRRDSRAVRAFTSGMAPLTLGLLLATGWVLTEPMRDSIGAMVLVVATAAIVWRTRLSPTWLVGAGALAGAFGLT